MTADHSCKGCFNDNCQKSVFGKLLITECAKPQPDTDKALFYISQGPNFSMTDDQRNDAVNLCAQGKDATHGAILKALLGNPTVPRNQPNLDGMTAAMNARLEGNTKMAAMLADDPAVDLGFIMSVRTPEWLCAQSDGDQIGAMYEEKHKARQNPPKFPILGPYARVS